ncbi:aldehyde ferredoxin oxidoreductase, partial [candidate division KSB1 bacterium]
RAGYDALVITGRAPHPVYLYINEEKAEIYDASHLWSKDVHQTTDILFREYEPGTHRVLAIGIGGEKLVRFAAIINEKNRAYGRCGPGAVMGSKNLKAIVVSGNKSVPIKDEKNTALVSNRGITDLKLLRLPNVS